MIQALVLRVALAVLLAPGSARAAIPALDGPTKEVLAKVFDRPSELANTAAGLVCIVDIQHPEMICKHVETKPVSEYRGRITKARAEQLTSLKCVLLHFSEIEPRALDRPHVKAILFSGRSKSFSKELDAEFFPLIRQTRIPILGFCGGMQLIGQAYGAPVAPLRKLRADEKDPSPAYHPGMFKEWGFLPVTLVQRDPLFDSLPDEILVREMHAYQMTAVPAEFALLASTSECRVEAIKHKDRVLYGTQFHPEAYDDEHPHGMILLRNFFRVAGLPPRAATDQQPAVK